MASLNSERKFKKIISMHNDGQKKDAAKIVLSLTRLELFDFLDQPLSPKLKLFIKRALLKMY
jgi:hypothetical protein